MNSDSTNVMLFNLKDDPMESNNLANENVEMAGQLASDLLSWRREMPVEMVNNVVE